ncbi:MAG: VIT1/CCC1 transporter family protein [Candidatus Anstonellales archaeon]
MAKKKYFDLEKHIEEEHRGIGSVFSQIILGAQDGIVNTLGVLLGVLAASKDLKLTLVAGIAAAFAESISMAAVAYTSSRAEIDYYYAQLKKEEDEISKNPEEEIKEVYEIYYRKGFRGKLLERIVNHITRDKKTFLDFMMKEELELSEPERHKALKDSFIVGLSALIGSFVPILPIYVILLIFSQPFFTTFQIGLIATIFTALILFFVGAYKAHLSFRNKIKDGLELALIGIVAALSGFFIGYFVNIMLL